MRHTPATGETIKRLQATGVETLVVQPFSSNSIRAKSFFDFSSVLFFIKKTCHLELVILGYTLL